MAGTTQSAPHRLNLCCRDRTQDGWEAKELSWRDCNRHLAPGYNLLESVVPIRNAEDGNAAEECRSQVATGVAIPLSGWYPTESGAQHGL